MASEKRGKPQITRRRGRIQKTENRIQNTGVRFDIFEEGEVSRPGSPGLLRPLKKKNAWLSKYFPQLELP
jgi:hypothetical protein